MGYSSAVGRLRGLCILSVMLMHYAMLFPRPFSLSLTAFSNGYFGVTVFFVISGFLITSNIIERHGTLAKISFRDFYVRRVARVAPLLLLTVAVLSALSYSRIDFFMLPEDHSLAGMVGYVLTFRYNIFYISEDGSPVLTWAILWSLSVEEMFYLVYPIIIAVFRNERVFVFLLCLVVLAGIVERSTSVVGKYSLYEYFGCFDAIALGALTALASRRSSGSFGRLRASLVIAVGSVIVATVYVFVPVARHFVLGPDLMAVGAALVLFGSRCLPSDTARLRGADPIAFLGDCSYELYLLHMTVFGLIQAYVGAEPPVNAPLFFAAVLSLTVAASATIRRFYVEPLNRRIKRLGTGRGLYASPLQAGS